MIERRRALDGAMPRRVVRARATARAARRRRVHRGARPARATRRCRRRWPSPASLRNLTRDERFGPRVVPIIPDEARTFGMDALFREVEDLRLAGPALRAGRRRPAALLQRGEGRPDPRGGHHRGGRDVELHRRGHELRAPRRADGAVLHLLFDVRVPAGRRPDLGRRRRAGPRLPARRDGGTHDAARRRACSTRTATACVLASAVPTVPGLRPRVRVRDGDDREARHAPHVRDRSPRTSSTTSRCTTRTTRCRRCPTGRRGRHHRGPLQVGRRARRARAERATVLFSGSAHGAAREPRRPSWPSTTDVGAELWSATSYKALREEALDDRALEPAASRRSPRARRSSTGCSPTPRGRSSRSPTS